MLKLGDIFKCKCAFQITVNPFYFHLTMKINALGSVFNQNYHIIVGS